MTAINKFNKSMIYVIRSYHTDQYYIGSTTQILCKRFSDHNMQYKRYLREGSGFTTSFKIIELGDAYIELLEEINCENRPQLEKREGELIRMHKSSCVNMVIPCRTMKEYRTDNCDKIAEQKTLWRIKNSEKINEQRRAKYAEKKLLKDLESITI
jgi:predicted GIY-YIG superfamily endonuclease